MTVTKDAMIGRRILGRYHVVRPLARGGMGLIYLGRLEGSARFARPVVIKTVLPSSNNDGGAKERFIREARIVSLLRHSSIVSVIDFGRVDAAYVMVLEYVHGFNLSQWSRYVRETHRRISVEHAVHVALGLLEALEYAHQLTGEDGTPLGIVHRDISPANLIIDLHGQIKLHDFGIARSLEDEYKTQDGSFRGTLPFTPPEALHGAPPRQTFDLYACGVVLYELLSGKNPFHSKETSATVYRILNESPPLLNLVRAEVSTEIAHVVNRALAKRPEDRFASASELANALRKACPFDEASVARDFARQIAADFTGDMPLRLGIPSLEERNAAWRAGTSSGSLDSLPAVPAPAEHSRSDPAPRRSSNPVPEFAEPQSNMTTQPLGGGREGHSETATLELSDSPFSRLLRWFSAKPRRLAWTAGAAALLLAGSPTAVLTMLPRGAPAPSSGRFLLLEKGSVSETSPAAYPSSVIEPPADPALTRALEEKLPPPNASKKKDVVAPRPAPLTGASLSAALQPQRSRIEACFRQHTRALEGTPQVSLRFDVDARGSTRSVALIPAEISRLPLGRCILSVARSTQFGPLPEDVTFTIPITARKFER